MSLTNLSFIGIYLPILLILYYNPFFKGNKFRKIVLLCANLGLYFFSEPIYVLLLLLVIVFNYYIVKLADKTNLKIFRVLAITLDILILLFFKYINTILSLFFVNKYTHNIIFPIGLSYFIFKSISYVVDSADEKSGNIIDVAIYISNFLTIVSGPLSIYKDELSDIKERELPLKNNIIYKGLERFIIGLGKKIIIADSLESLVVLSFSSNDLSVFMAWAGAIAYTLQLFFDFSGYTDIAIGIGYLFGFNLPNNFDYPYLANSVSDFWKRWHISLTKWFTRYIYIPLGGSRVKKPIRHIFNLFVVWLVTGIWHGSTATFILWSMIYFVLQLIEKYTTWSDVLQRIHLGHVYTLLVIVLEWVIFRSSSISAGIYYIKMMFGLNNNIMVNLYDVIIVFKYIIPLSLGVVFSTKIGLLIYKIVSRSNFLTIIYNLCLVFMFVICMFITIGKGYSAPLYAGF